MLVAIVSDGRGGSGDRGIVSIPSASIDNDIAARYKAILRFWIAIFYVNKILYNHLITISRASSLGVGEDGGGGGSLGMPGTGVNSCGITCFGITCRSPYCHSTAIDTLVNLTPLPYQHFVFISGCVTSGCCKCLGGGGGSDVLGCG